MSNDDSYDYDDADAGADDDVHTLLTHKTANEHARRYRSGAYKPAEYVQDEDGSGTIIRFAINDMTDEEAAKMSSEEQCNIVINSMMGDFDGSARLFKKRAFIDNQRRRLSHTAQQRVMACPSQRIRWPDTRSNLIRGSHILWTFSSRAGIYRLRGFWM